jgi:predicted nucleic acid-binding protein
MIEFFDASALVKLYVREPGSGRVSSASRTRRPVVSRIAYAEVVATLGRLLRRGTFDKDALDQKLEQLEDDFSSALDVVEVKSWLDALVRHVTARHELRGMDAIHLASALSLKPRPRFWSTDNRLADAAEAEGLRVIRPGM